MFIQVSQSMDFSSVIIDDDLLANLLEYPTNAFEIVADQVTNEKRVQLKKTFSKKFFEGECQKCRIKLCELLSFQNV